MFNIYYAQDDMTNDYSYNNNDNYLNSQTDINYQYNNNNNLYSFVPNMQPILPNTNNNNNGYTNHENTNYNNINNDNEYFNNEEQEAYNDFLQQTGQQHRTNYANEEEEIEEIEEEEELDAELEQATNQYYNHSEFGPICPPFDFNESNPPAPLDFDDIKQIKDSNKLFMMGHDGFWIIVTLLHKRSDGFTICHENGKEYFIHAFEGVFPVFYKVPSDNNSSNTQNEKKNKSNDTLNKNVENNNSTCYTKLKESEINHLMGKELLVDVPGQGIIPMIYMKYESNNGRSFLKSKDGFLNQMILESFNYEIRE